MKVLIHTKKWTYPFELYSVSTPVETNNTSTHNKPEYKIYLEIEKNNVNYALLITFLKDINHNIFSDTYLCDFIMDNGNKVCVNNCKIGVNNYYEIDKYYQVLIITTQKVELFSIKKIRFKKLKQIFNMMT